MERLPAVVIVASVLAFSTTRLHAQAKPQQPGPVSEVTRPLFKQCIVKSESVAVYAQMSKTSAVVRSLRKGHPVRVGMEIRGSRGAWCAIRDPGATRRMGYVLCKHLEIERPQKTISPHTFTVPKPRELAAFQALMARLRPELPHIKSARRQTS